MVDNDKKITNETWIVYQHGYLDVPDKLYDRLRTIRLLGTVVYEGSIRSILTGLWLLNEPVQREVDKQLKLIPTNRPFIAIHLRMGDKIARGTAEGHRPDLQQIRHILTTLPLLDIFMASDDYREVRKFEQFVPDRTIRYITRETQRGYDQRRVNTCMSSLEIYHSLVQFLTEIEIIRKCSYYIGGRSSNLMHTIINLSDLTINQVFDSSPPVGIFTSVFPPITKSSFPG
jgi:hypothetical protein